MTIYKIGNMVYDFASEETNTSYYDIAIQETKGLRKVKKGDIYAAGIR